MWTELYFITTDNLVDFLSEELMALGACAITLQDAEDQPIFEPPPNTMPLWNKVKLIALFSEDIDLNPALDFLNQQNIETFATRQIADQNWERTCLEDFKPLQFGDKLWICPSWHTINDPNAVIIALDPGLAFGTGTHATTRMCLEWLEANIQPNMQVIDYGSGSGILSLAAIKLGAKKIFAVDNDPQAILATQENAKRNNINEKELSALLPQQLTLSKVNLIIANILAAPLIELAPYLSSLLLPAGHIVLSGILQAQADEVMKAYTPWIHWQAPVFLDGWTRLAGIKTSGK